MKTKNIKNKRSVSPKNKQTVLKKAKKLTKKVVQPQVKTTVRQQAKIVKRPLNCGRRVIHLKKSQATVQPNIPFAGYFAAVRGNGDALSILDRTFETGGITGFYLEDARPFETLEEAREAIRANSLRLAEDLKIDVTDKATFPVYFFQINGVQRNTVTMHVSVN